MSLLKEYESLKHLQGFTLGYYKFFTAFKLELYVHNNTFAYKWNDVNLGTGSYTVDTTQHVVIPTCEKCFIPPNGIGFSLRCAECMGKEMDTISYNYWCSYPSRKGDFIEELKTFAYEQTQWIGKPETQALSKRSLKEECQRRINFFVNTLHTYFAGKPNVNNPYYKGTLDPILRDIRNTASLCLRD